MRVHRGAHGLPPRRNVAVLHDHRHGAEFRRGQQHQRSASARAVRVAKHGREGPRVAEIHFYAAESVDAVHFPGGGRSRVVIRRGRRANR